MVKIGIIGCGKIAEKHLSGYRALKDLQVVLYDSAPDQASKLANQFGHEAVPAVENLFADPTLTAVDICTPTPTHESLIRQAIQAGKHVFCEKPLTDDLASAQSIKEEALATDRIIMAGFLYRFHPAFELVKQILEENIIGEPYLALFRLGGRGSHRLWKHKRDQGGGAVNEIMVHMLDLALWYFGKLEITAKHVTTVLSQREVEGRLARVDAEDFALVQFKSSTGVKVVCEADLVTPSYMNYMEVMGTEGSLFTSILDHIPTVVFCKRPRGIYQQGNNFFNFPKTNLFERELGYFVRCLQNVEQPKINPLEDSLELMRLVEEIKNKKGDI